MRAPGTPRRRFLRALGLGLAILLGLVIYAYGFQVTKVNLDEARTPHRQQQLVRILRALAQPDLLTFPQEEITLSAPFFMPCPEVPPQQREINPRQPYILLTPSCVEPGGKVQVEGFNLEPNADATIFLVPASQVTLRQASLTTDGSGHFLTGIQLPERSEDVEQAIKVVTRQISGAPRLSRTTFDTWDKIVETVFLALLATTLGTLIAVPLSFLAARNLMKGITSSALGLSVSILVAPVGLVSGAWAASRLASWTASLSGGAFVASLTGALAAPAVAWFAARWALPQDESVAPSLPIRLSRGLALFGATLAAIVGLAFGAEVLVESGRALEAGLPSLPFLGKFVGDLGDILQILLSAVTGLAAAGYLAGLGARLSRILAARLPRAALRGVETVVSIAAGAALFTMIGAGVVWLYELRNPVTILSTVAGVGAVIGLVLSVRYGGRDTIPIGLAVYYLARTIFNGLRAIEALIMAVVFVVWVGIGPFAGVLALSLHSIAAMAKLYSEQVESILPGPLEAITATGATRIQTIIYAVIPQIIPPYISFTMYRWDINVRMSTIIGFAGGGGIGFLLFQNINLLNYRAASVQMLAIAIVVASMDYLSSALRERVV